MAAGVGLGALVAPRVWAQDSAKKGFKVALIGCGGRGMGALENCIEAGKVLGVEVKLVAAADAFQDRANQAKQKYGLPDERTFVGFDAYQKAIATEAEIILMATPPGFRPPHLAAAIAAGKHVFMEKPVAVDPVGARKIMEAGELAKQKGLSIVAGTQRRHQQSYLRGKYAVENGAIGPILGGVIMWNGQVPWIRGRQAGESDTAYMTRNWLNFTELSGDHIVEQHVHNIDVANWYLGRLPVAAVGFGGRARRETGNQYDFFSIDLDYGSGVHIHSQCRQIAGCTDRVGEFFRGADGDLYGGGKWQSFSNKKVDVPEFRCHDNPYVQEHVDLLQSIMKGTPLNEAKQVADSTLVAIMGRISAYTGQMVRWVDVTVNDKSPFFNLALSPSAGDFEKGEIKAPADDVWPLPGKGKVPKHLG